MLREFGFRSCSDQCCVCTADCICGSDFNFVCAFGLTWQSTCDASCGGYTCPQTAGVCHYKANTASGQIVTPQGRAKPGGVTGGVNFTGLVPGSCRSYCSIFCTLLTAQDARTGLCGCVVYLVECETPCLVTLRR